MQLTHVVEYVADMDRAVTFYRDTLGLPLKFQTPEWSEFETGGTPFALQLASPEHPAGQIQLGFGVPDIHQFYGEATARGAAFTLPPVARQWGTVAELTDPDGAIPSFMRAGK
jgi:catechol 2,3-dioxygenase-like lactoylglutathione lyase family enzyme